MRGHDTEKSLMLLVLMFMCFLQLFACSTEQVDPLVRIKKAGHISFAMSGSYPPFSFYNKKNELVGFDVDVAREVSKRLGVKVKIIETEWNNIIEGLRSKAYDGILGSMSVNEERAAAVNFSVPYYYSRSRVIAKKGSPLNDLKDLQGKIVGIAEGATFEKDAKALGAKSVHMYKNEEEALIQLQKGVLDAVIADEIVAQHFKKRKYFFIETIGDSLHTEKIAVAFRKEDETLIQQVNKILNAMHKDGTLRRLSEKIVKNEYN